MKLGFQKKVRYPVAILIAVLVVASAIAMRRERHELASTYVFHPDSKRIAIWRPYGADQKPIDICIDGDCQTIPGSAPIHSEKLQPYFLSFSKIPSEVSVPRGVEIASLPSEVPVMKAGCYEDSDNAIVYDGGWVVQSRDGPSSDKVHTAIDPDSRHEIHPSGGGLRAHSSSVLLSTMMARQRPKDRGGASASILDG